MYRWYDVVFNGQECDEHRGNLGAIPAISAVLGGYELDRHEDRINHDW